MPSIDPAPVQIDYTQYMSLESKNRKRSQLKELRPYFEIPGMISFGVGVPHPSTWPVNAMTVSIPFANQSAFIPGYNSPDPSSLLPLAPYTPATKGFLAPDLTDELQYSATYGHKHLIAWVKEHLQRMHDPKYDEWEVLLTAGNTDGTDGILRACLDRGDYLLVEEFAYPGLLSPAETLGIRTLGIPVDTSGVSPEALEETLSNWDEEARGGARPKFLLMVPTCSNPGGMTVPVQRKREIYAVCRKWDVMIIEDDPYCYLQIRPNGADSPIVPTFFSIDTDGRVLRIDSFSKFVAPGVRLGFVTGPKQLVEKVMNTRESATQCPSGLSVAVISTVLRAWGSHEGLERKYIPHISDIYSKRCLTMIDLLHKYVPASTIEIPEGSGGMFLWVRLKVESHPDFETKSAEEISAQVFQRMISAKVLMCPSIYFKAPSLQKWTREQEARRIFVRISYSLPPPDEMEEGTRRMGEAMKAEWGL